MQEVAGERGGYLHGRGALDSDDLLHLKEQMEVEEDAERLLRRIEKHLLHSRADTSPASVPLPLRVEPKPKSGLRQQDLLKRVVEVRPKRQRISSTPDGRDSSVSSSIQVSNNSKSVPNQVQQKELSPAQLIKEFGEPVADNPVKSMLAAYESSEDEE